MSDYTPSIDEIGDAYTQMRTREAKAETPDERILTAIDAFSEFERGMTEHDESVRAEERERIAQAIIERTSGYYSMSGPPEDRTRYYLGINHAVRIVREGA